MRVTSVGITFYFLESHDIDLKILRQENRTSPGELGAVLASVNKENLDSNLERARHLLVDVRSEPEFEMCRIEGAVNHPIDKLSDRGRFSKLLEEIKRNGNRGEYSDGR
ncbi:hypothetical protein EVAR_6923_1 [Eumeta japonica]|uniref:Rhodanese domain-containing protein n=1 Tax=Eumeta variegata TaxID=151549 RepID=A0A4C1TGE4_EUMVA|nr:hypothetical protein EVAR_6923_1 [Eumeta japonica]